MSAPVDIEWAAKVAKLEARIEELERLLANKQDKPLTFGPPIKTPNPLAKLTREQIEEIVKGMFDKALRD